MKAFAVASDTGQDLMTYEPQKLNARGGYAFWFRVLNRPLEWRKCEMHIGIAPYKMCGLRYVSHSLVVRYLRSSHFWDEIEIEIALSQNLFE
jgi:hypothetical protein